MFAERLDAGLQGDPEQHLGDDVAAEQLQHLVGDRNTRGARLVITSTTHRRTGATVSVTTASTTVTRQPSSATRSLTSMSSVVARS